MFAAVPDETSPGAALLASPAPSGAIVTSEAAGASVVFGSGSSVDCVTSCGSSNVVDVAGRTRIGGAVQALSAAASKTAAATAPRDLNPPIPQM